MIINLYNDYKKQESCLKHIDILKKLSKDSGIGIKPLSNILTEYKRTGSIESVLKMRKKSNLFDKIDDLDKQGIRKVIYSFWLRRELPTLNEILKAINNDYLLPNFARASLHRLLKQMQFIFVSKKMKTILTENENIINNRRNYLNDIRHFREQNKTIYYFDETWINFRDCSEVMWKGFPVKRERKTFENETTANDNRTNMSQRLIALHMGSKKGFIENGLFCFEPDENTEDYYDILNENSFKEWFERILPTLEPNSVIVMDNAPHHLMKIDTKLPTRCWQKKDIITWLESYGETFEKPLLIGQLLVRVKQIENKLNLNVIDCIAQKANHTVLRIPDHHNEFNPMDSAWVMVKEYIKQNNITFKTDVTQLLLECVNRVTPQDWDGFIQEVIEEENKIWEMDESMDEIIDSIKPCDKTVHETKEVLSNLKTLL